jgi:beta-galactosidase
MTDFTRRRMLSRTAAASAAITAVAGVANAQSPASQIPVTAPNASPRERTLLDAGWRFHFGHASDPTRDFGFGADLYTYAKSGNAAPAAAVKFDASAWTTLDLPHDWAVELPFKGPDKPLDPALKGEDPRAAQGFKPIGRDYPETSVGWYRREIELPASDAGRRISLEFDGVFRDALVLFNGYVVGANQSGYSPFRIDVTDFVDYGAKNVLTVRVDATLGEGWFYSGAGIYRHVWLVKTDPVHVPQWGAFVRATPGGGGAAIAASIEVANESERARQCEVVAHVLDPDGAQVAELRATPADVAPGSVAVFEQTAHLEKARLWSIETPQLYRLAVEVRADGARVDRYETPFGIRSFRLDPDKGAFLNDVPIKLKGTCNHQDHAGVGAALPDRLHAFRIEKLKAMGSNAYRTAHHPHALELMDACDRLGMLVIDETRMMSSSPEGISELERLIRRDRNRPSVVLWSIGNEEPHQSTERGARIARAMVRRVKALDPTRPIIEAMDGGFGQGVTTALDVMGFNYRQGEIDKFHAAFPKMPIVGTETASTVSARGIYKHDDVAGYSPAYDIEAPWWATTAESWWTLFDARPFVAGGFVWTGFDYKGEPTPFSRWPNVASQFGIMDSCGFPKDNYYYYRAWWQDEPVLHLFPHWNWEGREGQPIQVWVHSNLDRVELFLNGVSLGSRDVERDKHLAWEVTYKPGRLTAHGYKGKKRVLTATRETTGPAASIALSADRSEILGDGRDVVVVSAEIRDAHGRMVPLAADEVRFSVRGPGSVIGVGNGDPASLEPDKADKRRAFNGLCMAIVQSRGPGAIEVTAEAAGLKPATVALKSRLA